MRDPERIGQFCDRLKAVWSKDPDLRFSQMIVNAFDKMALSGKDPFFAEDNEMIEFIELCERLRWGYEYGNLE